MAKWQHPNPAALPTNAPLTSYLKPPTTHTPLSSHPSPHLLTPLSPPTQPTFAHKPQFPLHTAPNPEPCSHSLIHPCHISLQIKFTLGPPLSKKPKERQRGNEIEGLTSLPGSRAHDRHLLNPFIHMSQDFTKVHAYLSASLC